MEESTTTKARMVEQLITKFFYRNNQLFFQILLNGKDNFTITYGEYTDYTTYKKVYNQLLCCKATNTPVNISENKVEFLNSHLL